MAGAGESLDLMTAAPVPLELVVLGKVTAHWLTTGLPLALAAPMWLGPAPYLRANGGDPALPAFGYLKPVIRRAASATRSSGAVNPMRTCSAPPGP